MTITANLHNISTMKSERAPRSDTAWLKLQDANRNEFIVFMDARLADAIEEAFYEYENWLSSQEGPTFDEALGAKCDAEARMDEARKLKGMS